ncbi:MAG: serine hydrolase domain-containing protein [Bacteroidales bacterium]
MIQKQFKHFVLAVILFFPGFFAASQSIETAGFRRELEECWKQTEVPAAAFGFATAHGQVYTETFGPGQWSAQDSLTGDHIFRIASMTKAITSVAVLQLVEQGLLELDQPVENYLPGIRKIPILGSSGELVPGTVPITLRHLLTHTSGFGYAIFDRRLGQFQLPDNWPHKDHPRLQEAGTGWLYGTSTDWAGRLVEVVSGLNLEEYLRKHLTGPLGMDHTWFQVPDSLQDMVVTLGFRDPQAGGAMREVAPRPLGTPVSEFSGGAGLHSSLNDYLRFLQCILYGGSIDGVRILREETVASLFVDQLPLVVRRPATDRSLGAQADAPTADGFAHGLSWALEIPGNEYGRRPGSGYWSGYFNTFFSVDIHTGVAVVVMTNIMPFSDPEATELYKKFEAMVRLSDK